jgi:thiol-disulfide isomerase/thioredoxin
MNLKHIIVLLLIAPITAFAQKDFIRFSGKIENRNGDSIMILSNVSTLKVLKVDQNGYFSDTLKADADLYALSDQKEMTTIFLKNGFDLNVKFDGKQFDETIHYEGIGGRENNFLARQILVDEKFDEKHDALLDETQFASFLTAKTDKQILELTKSNFDKDFVRIEQEYLIRSAKGATAMFAKKAAIAKLRNTPSPLFSYENAAGGVTKLEDLKGKYVFIDIWATWCKPCIAELPSLKKAEERFKDKNIVFVSLSVDYQKNREKWKSFIAEKKLTGVQVIADQDWKSKFILDYAISAIPRFILIDPEGKVVDADAPRPSSAEFIPMLDKLLL